MSSIARGGFQFFITFTDDFSRYGYIYLMRNKSESFEKFKEFQNEVQNQLGKTIKFLQSDRGGEYLSHEFVIIWNNVELFHSGLRLEHLSGMGFLNRETEPCWTW